MKKFFCSFFIAAVCYSTIAQPLPSYVPASGLLAWYPFSGNAIDGSGHGYDGTVSGATLTTDRFGISGNAYLFNGSSATISTSLHPPTGSNARTVSCWFKYNSTPSTCDDAMVIAGYGGTTESCGQARKNFSLELDYTSAAPQARVDGICIYNQQSGDTLDNSWHFFAAVYNPSYGDFRHIKLYVDGVFRTTTCVTYSGGYGIITDALSTFEIGKGHYSCSRYFDGKIDEIGVWDRALAEYELTSLYWGAATAASDSFSAYADDNCTIQRFSILPVHYNPALSVTTYFGDGLFQTDTFSATTYYSRFNHIYNASGTYVVKHVLYNGTTAIDSVNYTRIYRFCRTLPLSVYYDVNSNCVHEPSVDPSMYESSLIKIDSAGIPMDTVSITSGVSYRAYGPVGTAYTIGMISTAPGLYASCPTSGLATYIVSSTPVSEKSVGLSCSSTPGYDLKLFTAFRAGHHRFGGMIIAKNSYCTPPSAVLTMQMNPKYNLFTSFAPLPSSISGNLVSWNINTLSSAISSPFVIYADMEGSASVGDTLMTVYKIDPLSGDANGTDNIVIRNDTVRGGFDPNDIAVSPAGCLPPGVDKLTYTIRFENTGNDTAFNIYVLDTMSPDLDVKSLSILAASARMNTSIIRDYGLTVVKFDFPGINLLDSAHSKMCGGMLVYSINLRTSLTSGTIIPNRAGIYFDENPAVLTNTVTNKIGCPVTNVPSRDYGGFGVFPNPVTEKVVLQADPHKYSQYIITNNVGYKMISGKITQTQTEIDVHLLSPGLYYIQLSGDSGNMVQKLVKM